MYLDLKHKSNISGQYFTEKSTFWQGLLGLWNTDIYKSQRTMYHALTIGFGPILFLSDSSKLKKNVVEY